ncbi:alpha/beta fold hydrolase [Novosphingobium sp. TCA1]|uniref:alpha/beta fold hydrolase n=1 Tax=Novosphingobium sp. TCA1 TaxID=2682474 RepID=UPI001308CF62|nr:alpha/beta fold hydrolase [Novosphingobium sp. TCA1]GFE76087.1 hydrolase [Novosphingobium sp. TCA1]
MIDGTPNTHVVRHEGGSVAFDDTEGAGPIVLGIPGMGDLRSEYRLIRPALQQAGLRVVTMDVRGFGETSAQWSDYSARAVARDAIAVLQSLDAGPAFILGNSFAAGSALWAAREAPSLVRGVVLLGPIVRDLPLSTAQQLILKIGFAGPWRTWFWTTYWTSLFTTQRAPDHNEVKEAIARNLKEPGRMDALLRMLSLSKADTAAILDDSTVPALVIMGTKDPDFLDPSAEAQALAAQLTAETMMVEGAGHYPHVEMAGAVAARITTFINAVRSRNRTNGTHPLTQSR